MSSFALKLFAMVFMLIDHLGVMLYDHHLIAYDPYHMMRTLGRFSFPVYCFLLAEGFRRQREDPKRLWRHVLLLGILAGVSEPFFDRLFRGAWSVSAYQNVIFTLLIAFCGLWLAEREGNRPLPRIGIGLLCMGLAWQISSDYRAAGVLLVFLCGFYLDSCGERGYAARLLGMLGVMVVYYGFTIWSHSGFGGPGAFWHNLKSMGIYGLPHLLLVPLLASYSGKRGPRIQILHRCYQWYYPVHLALLCGAAALLG